MSEAIIEGRAMVGAEEEVQASEPASEDEKQELMQEVTAEIEKEMAKGE